MILGKGQLTWNKRERVSDRYGAVFLMNEDDYKANLFRENLKKVKGKNGSLEVKIIEGRESSHIGDILCGLNQKEVPEQGDNFVIGTGTLFEITEGPRSTLNSEFTNPIGLKPEDTNGHWLDTEKLYNVHESIVELHFIQH